MVYFTCFTCDATVKKPQLEKHLLSRCGSGQLSCIDCKQIFQAQDARNHVICKSEAEMFHGQYYQPKGQKSQQNQKAQKKDRIWLGWKKTIRKTLKQKENFTEKISKLKSEVMKKYIDAGVSFDLLGAEKQFKQKITNEKFKITGDSIRFLPLSERE